MIINLNKYIRVLTAISKNNINALCFFYVFL